MSNITAIQLMPVIRFIDLFCGIGGSRVGFEAACRELGLQSECVFSCDIKVAALTIYNKNFPRENVKPTDITEVDEKQLPEFDVLIGGFPCQSFSSAGKREGFNDSKGRGVLFMNIIRFAKEKKPKLMILENVENLEAHDGGNTLRTILKYIEDAGYIHTHRVLNASLFGVPQNRKRIFIVAHLPSVKPVLLDELEPSNYNLVGSVIDHDDTTSNIPERFLTSLSRFSGTLAGKSIKDKRGGTENIHSWDLNVYGDVDDMDKTILNKLLLERRKKSWAEQKKIVWMDGMPLTLDEIATFITTISKDDLKSRLERLVAQKYLCMEKPKDLVDGKRVYSADGIAGYNITKGKLSFPVSKFLDPATTCPTLTATDACKLAIVTNGGVVRRLNRTELKRISGFPMSFDTCETKNNMSDIYDVFGNTICPPVIQAVSRLALRNLWHIR